MTGMERNSLQVAMAAFAPLLSHWNDRACPHNMIIFDNHRCTHTHAHTSLSSACVQRQSTSAPADGSKLDMQPHSGSSAPFVSLDHNACTN